jgi:hypothetical protein
MRTPAREPVRSVRDQRAAVAARTSVPRGARSAAIALQRTAGNRVTSRILARWIKHPDDEKKGVVVPDVVAAEYTRFNPPTNE